MGIIRESAALRFFFHDTNHLSDRELYVLLHEHWLDHPTADIPLEAETNTHLNVSEFDAHAGWLPGDDDPSGTDEPDPLGLAELDRAIAAGKAEGRPDQEPGDPAHPTLHSEGRAATPERWISPACLTGRQPRGGWFHDLLGSRGEEETQLWLRYYASDEECARHARESRGGQMPPKAAPPFQRDWRLPKGPL